MSSEKIREDFQTWFAKNYPKINREETAQDCLFKMIAAQSWEHSRAAIEVELPQQSGANRDWNQAIRFCHQAIASLGLKVKP